MQQSITDIDKSINQLRDNARDTMYAVLSTLENESFAIIRLKEDNDDFIRSIMDAIADEFISENVEFDKTYLTDYGFGMQINALLTDSSGEQPNEYTIYLKLAVVY